MNFERHADHTATARPVHPDNEYAWFRDGSLPRTREDMIAEAVALVALLFALGIGLVIALLPVSAKAAALDTPSSAASAPSLQLSAFKIVPAATGKPEQRVAATDAKAGDQLEYQAVYRNPTAATLHHVLVTVPVPVNGVDVVLGSAAPPATLASTDGKTFAPLPLQRSEVGADGKRLTKPAPAADYRFLRWDLGDVPAGATRLVSTRVQVLGAASTAVAAR